MKQQLITQISQAIQFVLLALIKLMMIVEYEIKKLLKYQTMRLVLVMVLVLLIITVFAFAPSIDGGTGDGGG